MTQSEYSIESIKYIIDRFELISFDVFDTLLVRKIARPTDVFRFIERKYNITDFAKKRIEAEQQARQNNREAIGSSEVSLAEIYDNIRINPLNLPRLMNIELETENFFLERNEFYFEVYKHALQRRKKIIATSDVYLSGKQVNSLLNSNNIYVDKVYTSSDYQSKDYGKYNGKIFSLIMTDKEISAEKILHIGDNEISDFQNPMSLGITSLSHKTNLDTLLQRPPFASGLASEIDRQNTLESTIILGAIANKFSEIDKQATDLYRFGYCYGGIIILSFAKYICELCKRKPINRLLLIARDGYIVRDAFDALEIKDINYEILSASRRMMLVPLLANNTEWAIEHLFPSHQPEIDVEHELARLGLNGISFNHVERRDKPISREQFLDHYLPQLRNIANKEHQDLIEYLRQAVDLTTDTATDDLALVDIGWGLTIHKALDAILKTELAGFYVGSHATAYENGNINCFLFQQGEPQDIAEKIMGAVEIIELIFSDAHHAVLGPSYDGDNLKMRYFAKAPPEQLRDMAIHDIRRGAIDFVADMRDFFDILDIENLRNLCRSVFENIAAFPSQDELQLIGRIPHPRDVGQSAFKPISELWQTDETRREEQARAEPSRKVRMKRALRRALASLASPNR